MKRFFKILGLLLVLLFAVALLLPVLFKGQITEKAKSELNNNLKAEVNFKDVGVNLISDFPNFLVSLEELTIDGVGQFEGIRLMELEDFELELDLLSVLFGDAFEVESISAKNTTVNLRVLPDGTANYDIVKEEPKNEEAEASDTTSFELSLKEYQLSNFNLHYVDAQGQIITHIKNLNHTGSGDFTQDEVALKTQTDIGQLTVLMNDIAYLNKVALKSDFDVVYDQNSELVTLGQNHVDLNDLILNFSGNFNLPDSAGVMPIDLNFNTPKGSFKSLLSLIPAIYTQDFSSLTASGDFSLDGEVKGTYIPDAELYPSFDIKAAIKNGNFKYPSLPAGVEQVMLQMQLANASNRLDAMQINIPQAKALIANSPFDAVFHLNTPISDPDYKLQVKTDLNLANLAKVVPAQGYNYTGRLLADFSTSGKLSAIENEKYEAVTAQGYLKVTALSLKGDSLPMPIQIPVAEMNMSPQQVSLDQLEAKIGSSDLQANGFLNNVMAYALSDALLDGKFTLKGSYLNLNELSQVSSSEAEASQNASVDTASDGVVRLPKNVNLKLLANFDSLVYDNLTLKQIKGELALKEGMAQMKDVQMKGLGGVLALSGMYNSVPPSPEVDFNFKLQNIDFAESYTHLNMVKQLAPIMQNTVGNFSTGFNFKSTLNPDFTPELSSAQASGRLTTSALKTESTALQQIAQALKNPDLALLQLAGVNLNFALSNGQLEVEPFSIKAGKITGTVSGTTGLDQSIDYLMDLKLPLSAVGAQNMVSAGISEVPVKVTIGGKLSQPKVKTSLADMGKGLVNNLKNEAKEKLNEVQKEATEKVNAKAQNLVAEASKKGDALIATAEKQAQDIRDAAQKQAQRLKDEAYRRADKMEKEASGNPLKAAAARTSAKAIRKKADEQAQKVEKEADIKAEQLVNKAKQEKKKLVDEAKAKAQI
jgi:hypothetical protein